MKNYLYVIGTDPYKHSHGEEDGNGSWHIKGTSVEEALRIIFSGMRYPTEPVGRKLFLPGVSLAGVDEEDVIQIWSSEPDVVNRTTAWCRADKHTRDMGGLHNGNGTDLGLHLEIKAIDVEKYLTPARALLTGGTVAGAENKDTTISPMGAGLMKFEEMKHDLLLSAQREEMNLAVKSWEMDSAQEALKGKVALMNQQIGILNTYLYGTRYRTQIHSGKSGTGKYAVFQNRQFLSEEIAILGNFQEFDFKSMEGLERWLVQSGRIWKFLPLERCILATRIRRDRKDYGDPLTNVVNNMENMRNMIWVRDGENVFHVDVDFDFHNAIFPARSQFDEAQKLVLNYLYEHSFKWKEPRNWHGEVYKKGDHDQMGEMRKKERDNDEPYYTVKTVMARFHTMEDWLASEYYTEKLIKDTGDAIYAYLKEINKKQMVFAVLLQGIVDNTDMLDVPKGTDLFNWETVEKYFTLLFDYSHALPWQGIEDKIAPYIDGKLSVGDWIVTTVEEYLPAKTQYGDGTKYKETWPMLFRVIALDTGKPVVNYYPIKKRRSFGEDYGARTRTKLPIRLRLLKSDVLRVPMSPSLAEQILDNRDWKKTHQWAVPLMVNYGTVLDAAKRRQNGEIIKFGKFKDADE